MDNTIARMALMKSDAVSISKALKEWIVNLLFRSKWLWTERIPMRQ